MSTADPRNRESTQGSTTPGASSGSSGSQGASPQSGTSAASANPSSAAGATRQAAGASGAASDRETGIATSRERSAAAPTGGGAAASGAVTTPDQLRGLRGLTPFALMRRLSEDMDRLFGDYPFGGFGLIPGLGSARTAPRGGLSSLLAGEHVWAPAVDVFKRGDDLVVHAELPGITRDNISVEASEGALVLSGRREQRTEENRGDTYRAERSFGSFQRVIPLPEEADTDHAQAKFQDGVLEITVPIPQRPQPQARKIDVK